MIRDRSVLLNVSAIARTDFGFKTAHELYLLQLKQERRLSEDDEKVLREHFLAWSGGFEPSDKFEVEVYVLYARDSRLNEQECREVLFEWMHEVENLI